MFKHRFDDSAIIMTDRQKATMMTAVFNRLNRDVRQIDSHMRDAFQRLFTEPFTVSFT